MVGRVSSVSERRVEEEEEEEEEAELILVLGALNSVSALFESGGGGVVEKRLSLLIELIDVPFFHEIIVVIVIPIGVALLTTTGHQLVDEERLLLNRLIHRCHLRLHHGHECDEIRRYSSRGDR